MACILIAGGSGLIGKRLSQLLVEKKHEVIHLSRKPNPDASFPTFAWDLQKGYIDEAAIHKADYVINLAGTGIADARWSDKRKKLIISSRVESTLLLKNTFEKLNKQPKAFLPASAIGFYGDRGNDWMYEASQPGTGFLAHSCIAWEKALQEVIDTGWRTVIIRIGIVLSTQGGALEKMITPMKFRAGAYFGNGQQYYSWIHIDDLCRMFIKGIEDKNMQGIYNGVAPNPATNKQFAYDLETAMGQKSIILPAPAFGLRLAMGEMADVVLTSARVSSQKVEDQGFQFAFPELVPALKDVIKRNI